MSLDADIHHRPILFKFSPKMLSLPLVSTSFFIYIFGGFIFYFFPVLYSALLHLPPLRFHCADGCWDRIQDRWHWHSDALTTRLDHILVISLTYSSFTLVYVSCCPYVQPLLLYIVLVSHPRFCPWILSLDPVLGSCPCFLSLDPILAFCPWIPFLLPVPVSVLDPILALCPWITSFCLWIPSWLSIH
jgi:hypothetical protein